MKRGMLLLALFSLSGHAAEDKVYLLATAGLSGGSVAQSIFLNEPDITDLQGCNEAFKQGQRDGDWLKYHHILRKDKMRGFSVQMQYRCVVGTQDIEPWFDRARYDYAYLVDIDEQSRLSVQPMQSMAACLGKYRTLPAEAQARRHCTKGSQRVR